MGIWTEEEEEVMKISNRDDLRTWVDTRIGDGYSEEDVDQITDMLRGLDGFLWPMGEGELCGLIEEQFPDAEFLGEILEGSDEQVR